MTEAFDQAWALLKFEEAWHPELGSVMTSPLDDMYVDLTSMYDHLPQYEGKDAHDEINNQIRERLESQGYDSGFFNAWKDGDDEYGDIDEKQKSTLKQTLLDIMEEHEGGKTIHHDDFEQKFA